MTDSRMAVLKNYVMDSLVIVKLQTLACNYTKMMEFVAGTFP